MPLQLTSAGLQVKDRAEIRSDIIGRLRASSTLGPAIRVDGSGVIVDALNTMVAAIGEIHEAVLDVNQARSLQSAEDQSLDNLGALVFVPRVAATRSTGTVTITGTPGTLIPGGSRMRIPDGPTFRLQSDALIGGGGTVDALIESVDFGPVQAIAGTITEIVDAVGGWASVTNAEDVIQGREQEEDDDYRNSIILDQQGGRAATPPSIRTEILRNVDNILSVFVINNLSNLTDVNGVPGHSVRSVIWPNTLDTDQIAAAIWRTYPAGIGIDGAETATVIDNQGFEQDVYWSWATQVTIYLEIDVVTTAMFPADGEGQVRAAVDTYALSLGTGDDVLPGELSCLIFQIQGVRSVVIRVGNAPFPVSTDPYDIADTEIADIDSADPRTVVSIT